MKRSFYQGAEVTKKYVIEPRHTVTQAAALPACQSIKGEAYRLAVANRHKSWARRYLKDRRSFG